MKKNSITLKIYRSDAENSTFRTYEISIEEPITLQNAIRYVYEKLDRTLAFRNYSCYKGVCGTCTVKLNGKNVRSCSVLLYPGDEAIVEPADGFFIIRDLVVDFDRKKDKFG